MKKFLRRIKGVVPTINLKIDIDLEGKHLVVIGSNGAGKTHFLRYVYDRLQNSTAVKELKALPKLLAALDKLREDQHQLESLSDEYHQWRQALQDIEQKLDEVTKGLSLDVSNKVGVKKVAPNQRLTIFYEANRSIAIEQAKLDDTLTHEHPPSDVLANYQYQGKNLEKHLVNLKQKQLTAEQDPNYSVDNDPIAQWLLQLESQLKELFDDPSLKLVFDKTKASFVIERDNCPTLRLQQLSSGMTAILAIYADLLLRANNLNLLPNELKGVVFIDEIDAHLAPNTQRLVLPFFIKSFPDIQFIVSCNSPVILLSTQQIATFDINKNTLLKQYSTAQSYDEVMENVFHITAKEQHISYYIDVLSMTLAASKIDYAILEPTIIALRSQTESLNEVQTRLYQQGMSVLARKKIRQPS